MNTKMFKNRAEAGKTLAGLLSQYANTKTVVYCLPRGGVVVGREVADILNVPLDIVITRKITHPKNPEFAVASVTETGELIFNSREPSVESESWFEGQKRIAQDEARRRRGIYLGSRERISCKGKNAIIVDDGVATGLSLALAIREIKKDVPWKTIVAVPVISQEIVFDIKKETDEFVCPFIDENFRGAVGAYYEDFEEVSDEDVVEVLSKYVAPEQKTIGYKDED